MPWDSLTLSVVLALSHLFLYSAALAVTWRPVITGFHLFLIAQTFSFAIRPILAASEGGFSLYLRDLSLYNQGLALQFVSVLFFILGYVVVWHVKRRNSGVFDFPVAKELYLGYFLLGLGLVSIFLMSSLSGSNWLPTERNVAITTAVPFGKVLFPLGAISFSVSLFGFLSMLSLRRISLVRLVYIMPGLVLSFVGLALLNQRGFILLAFILWLFSLERRRVLGYRRLLIWIGVAVLLLFVVRDVTASVLNVFTGTPSNEAVTRTEEPSTLWVRIKEYMLYRPNFDNADVWVVVQTYFQDEGPSLGSTFLAIPARFLGTGQRVETGLLTAVDKLNTYYWGDSYVTSNFGFNVTLPQELYINFGILGLFLTFFAGVLAALVDRWLWRINSISLGRSFAVFAAFFAGVFMGELGGVLQWGAAFLLFGLVFTGLERFSRELARTNKRVQA